jgi:hypothetical protein
MVKQKKRQLKLRPMSAAVLMAFACGSAGAADADRINELEKKLQQSVELIEKMSKRLGQLEAAQTAPAAATPAAAPAPAETSARIDQLEKNMIGIAESAAKKNDLGIPLHGFFDAGYIKPSNVDAQNANRNRNAGFSLGNLDFYLTPQLSDRVRGLVELAFEYNSAGAFSTDLERLQLGYTFSDAFTLWGGRFHTPYGYWNTAFHHGAQLQTSILRPRFIAFEDQGGIMQAHTVGAWGTGSVHLGDGKLHYDAWLGNAAFTTDDRAGGNGGLDFNRFKSSGGNMTGAAVKYVFGGRLDGLTLGVHGFRDDTTNFRGGISGDSDSKVQVNMLGGFAVYEGNDWEIISEYYRFNNDNQWVDSNLWTSAGALGRHKSWAGFAQIGRNFQSQWTPYYRWEKAQLDADDNYFASLNNNNGYQAGRSYNRNVLGLRFDVDPRAALKLEFSSGKELRPLANGGDFKNNEIRLQYAIRF